MILKNLNYWSICETPPDTVKRAKKAMKTMDVDVLPNPAKGFTHVGTLYVDQYMVRYLGRMIGDVFQFDPTTRRVTEWL